ncbi:YgiW/YdeI family stress tolerance OB fold protein [Enterobacter sp. ENT03]|uniref:YgiW/YdeI family stress tolerance OB fold protein n=1 Tax=Enterobacter sp. ENT03 TaxID=2854780 RepID=UPI001C4976DA|nr:NirD/YgiW/YdeI family stress tolerance protein [Enterobacter sp. ENT03]MBV7406923.1 YgiW/YdeI family stress tolerance OB fold protein [Enterobacter sp. ENT03]
MKNIAMLFTVLTLAATPALAATQGGFQASDSAAPAQNGGFAGPSGTKTTAEKAKSLSDDAWVTLTGKIEQRTGGDNYLFRDESGTIDVEIDDKRWNGQTVTPQDTVEIQGKVDKDWNSAEIEVKKITKMNK